MINQAWNYESSYKYLCVVVYNVQHSLWTKFLVQNGAKKWMCLLVHQRIPIRLLINIIVVPYFFVQNSPLWIKWRTMYVYLYTLFSDVNAVLSWRNLTVMRISKSWYIYTYQKSYSIKLSRYILKTNINPFILV